MWTNIEQFNSVDKNVSKFVFTTSNAVAEAVLYKYPTYEDRTVICCSTQSGCPMGCRFCGAGDYFVRSLTSDEIVVQCSVLLERTGVLPRNIKKLQIMFMSMGEPMLNYNNLANAIFKLNDCYPHARLLISTSAPRVFDTFSSLNSLSQEIEMIGLQFSVHESTDKARKLLIPSPTMTLDEIAATGESWFEACGRRPFFNYCVHKRNNTRQDVDCLLSHFNPKIWEATLSVICERDELVSSANRRQQELVSDFMSKMISVGYSSRLFNPAGQDDIGGGCGMLWYVQSWMKENPKMIKPSRGFGLPKIHSPT